MTVEFCVTVRCPGIDEYKNDSLDNTGSSVSDCLVHSYSTQCVKDTSSILRVVGVQRASGYRPLKREILYYVQCSYTESTCIGSSLLYGKHLYWELSIVEL